MRPDVLLLVNRASGNGHGVDVVDPFRAGLREGLGSEPGLEVAWVDSHAAARDAVACRLRAGTPPAMIACGGGGGTLRAVAEASDDVPLLALRLGSGNLVAKATGVPIELAAAGRRGGAALAARSWRRVPVVEIRSVPTGRRHLALGMCGFGPWGSVPGDIGRWRHGAPRLRSALAGAMGLETLNHLEYFGAGLARVGACLARGSCPRVGVGRWCGRLAGLGVINAPVAGLPSVGLFEPRARLVLLSSRGSLHLNWLAPDGQLSIQFAGGALQEFFVDEDPEFSRGPLQLSLRPGPPFLICGGLS